MSKPLVKAINANRYRHDIYRVFSDFVEMSALSLSNTVDLNQYDVREERYMRIIEAYNKEELNNFAKMFGELVTELENGFGDPLGSAFGELEIINKDRGQFFTPYHICKLIAKMQIDDTVKSKIEEQGFITVSEPACGGGAMVIAFADALKEAGINYQQHMHVTATDVDIRSVCMSYIQLSLLHIPAVIIHGNTLTLEEWSRWYTPAHILGGWNFRLKSRAPEQPVFRPVAVQETQLALFAAAK